MERIHTLSIQQTRDTHFIMDIRAPGKNYDEFVRRAQEEYGVQYIRGRVGKVYPRGDRMVEQGFDTLLGA